jgi:hypothetical protein
LCWNGSIPGVNGSKLIHFEMSVGLLAERVIGKVRLFISGEDLTNVAANAIRPVDSAGPWCRRAMGRRCDGRRSTAAISSAASA